MTDWPMKRALIKPFYFGDTVTNKTTNQSGRHQVIQLDFIGKQNATLKLLLLCNQRPAIGLQLRELLNYNLVC